MTAKDYKWGSHRPFLNALLDTTQIKDVTELGTGFFSTGTFLSRGLNVRSIENDLAWRDKVLEAFPDHKVEFHAMLGIQVGTRQREIPEEWVPIIRASYRQLNLSGDLLFVDQFSGLRAYSIEETYNNFNFIVFHDSERGGYGYDDMKYSNNYIRFDYKDLFVHTSMLYYRNTDFDLDEFKVSLAKYSQEYQDSEPQESIDYRMARAKWKENRKKKKKKKK